MKHEEVYDEKGYDNGWLKEQNFWFDPNHEKGFNIVDLDSIYPEKYFEVDHVKPETVKAYVDHVLFFVNQITNDNPHSVVEFGTAGGWFGEEFKRRGITIDGYEGTKAGLLKSSNRKSYRDLELHDLRRPIESDFYYSIALCTEVAEHIEPPFSATLVKSLVDASTLIWFSSEEPNTNPAHIHHPNEMPDKLWINLFEFYGFGCYKLPEWVFNQTEGRGKYIFYDKSVYEGNKFLSEQH